MPVIRCVSGGAAADAQQGLGKFFQDVRGALAVLGWDEGVGPNRYQLEPVFAEGNIQNFEPLMLENLGGVDCILALDSRAFWPVVSNDLQDVGDGPPIIATLTAEPVLYGMVKDLNRPGTRITGIYLPTAELTGVRFRLIKAAVPDADKVAVLRYVTQRKPQVNASQLLAARRAARALRMEIIRTIDLRADDDAAAIRQKVRDGLRTGQPGQRPQVLVTLHDAIMNYFAREIVEEVNDAGTPAIYGFPWFVGIGGLMGYGPDWSSWIQQIAWYVALLLNEPNPSNIPMQPILKYGFACDDALAQAQGAQCPGAP